MRRPLLGACLLFILCIFVFYLWIPPAVPDYRALRGKELYADGIVTSIKTQEYFGKTQTVYTLKNVCLQKSMADARNERYNQDQIYCYTAKRYENVYIGSHIILKGTFAPFEGAENPGAFDSQFYYHILGAGANLKSAELISTDGAIAHLGQILHQIHTYLLTKTEQLFSQPYMGVIQAVLLGYKGNLDSGMKQLYQEGGMLHMMTISGMHISMLGMSCVRFLQKIKVPTKISAAAGMLIVILYGNMIGIQASSFRAICMFSLKMFAKIRGRTYDALTALGVSAVLLLLKQPMYLKSSSFLLSYSAVLGIVVAAPVVSKLWQSSSKMIRKFADNVSVSFGILLTTLPIQLYFFYEYPLYSIFINLLVLPLLPFVVGIGVLALVLPWELLGLRSLLVFLCEVMLSFYEWICTLFQNLPYHCVVAGAPQWWQMVVYYLCLIICLVAMQKRTTFPRFAKQICVVSEAVLSCAIFLLFWRPLNGFTCHFLSVGQGDCAVVQYDGKTYLVDCGSGGQKAIAEDVLLPFLKYYGVKEVDGVFLSHADKDHISGIVEWLRAYEHSHIKINTLILPDLRKEALEEEFGEVLSLANVQNIPIHTASAGDNLSLGDLQVQVLNPISIREQVAAYYDIENVQIDANECSQVLLWEYQGQSVLMMGDVGTKTEEALLDELRGKKVSVLKVAHHGSRYSSSEAFLVQIRPTLSILSYGENNSYGHPHKEALEHLWGVGSIVLETPKSGCITVEITSDNLKIKQFKHNFIDN